MRIERINKISVHNKANLKAENGILAKQSISQSADTVSFKKGVNTALVIYVAKYGYNALKTNKDKARFCIELSKRFNKPDLSNGAKQVAETLFVLAKTSRKSEPDNMMYRFLTRNSKLTIRGMRMYAIPKLFHLLPEMPEDINSARAAKVAFMSSMVETGEYLDDTYFLQEFKSLPTIYNDDKVALLRKLFRDQNTLTPLKELAMSQALKDAHKVNSNYLSPDHNSDLEYLGKMIALIFAPISLPLMMAKVNSDDKKDAKEMFPKYMDKILKKKTIANVALLTTLDPRQFATFFDEYANTIVQQSKVAFEQIEKRLLKIYSIKNEDFIPEKNRFYGWYKGVFSRLDGRWGLCDKDDNSAMMSTYESTLAKKYYLDYMGYYQGDKEAIMKHFNLDEEYAEDLIKDYNLIKKTDDIKNTDELKKLYQHRIDEKKMSKNFHIQDSQYTLLSLSGRSDEIKALLADETKK